MIDETSFIIGEIRIFSDINYEYTNEIYREIQIDSYFYIPH